VPLEPVVAAANLSFHSGRSDNKLAGTGLAVTAGWRRERRGTNDLDVQGTVVRPGCLDGVADETGVDEGRVVSAPRELHPGGMGDHGDTRAGVEEMAECFAPGARS